MRTTLTLASLTIGFIGLVLELRGAYVTAQAFQLLAPWSFIKFATKLSFYWMSCRGELPLPKGLARLTELQSEYQLPHAELAFRGLCMVFVGLALQGISVMILFLSEVISGCVQ